MRIQPQLKSDISKVAVITAAFVLINWFFTFYNEGFVTTEYSKGPTELYDLKLNLILNSITGLLAGIIGGSSLVFVNRKFFRKKSYGYALKATFIAYTLVFIFITLFMSFLTAWINVGPGENFIKYYDHATIFLFSKMLLVFYILWGTVALFIIFFLQIHEKFGPGMFLKFLAGKYHSPREEQRIFMFIDMKSSTTIAEKIGNKRYFNLLNDLFTDITDAILSSEAEIYQYVGDEVVISWSMERGIREANCLLCFEKIRSAIDDLTPYYEKKYGINPKFKAGLHYGFVTAGEIGNIKKDIVYSGDVLNTTSRIQEQCNHYQVDFLVSQDTLQLMDGNIPFEVVALGNIELRGKKNKIELNTLVAHSESQVA